MNGAYFNQFPPIRHLGHFQSSAVLIMRINNLIQASFHTGIIIMKGQIPSSGIVINGFAHLKNTLIVGNTHIIKYTILTTFKCTVQWDIFTLLGDQHPEPLMLQN